MKPLQDAYGQSIRAYFNGEESYEVVEREDGFIGLSSGPSAVSNIYRDLLHENVRRKKKKDSISRFGRRLDRASRQRSNLSSLRICDEHFCFEWKINKIVTQVTVIFILYGRNISAVYSFIKKKIPENN